MTYTELLQKKEWWTKCNEILRRDRFICRDCRNLGFHNGGSFIKLDRLEDLNSMLWEWRFNGSHFSDFWYHFPKDAPYPTCDIEFHIESCEDDLIIYNLRILTEEKKPPLSIWTKPDRAMAVSKEKIQRMDANIYYLQNVSNKINSEGKFGSAFLFEFPRIISNDIYVNIEYSVPFKFDSIKYDRITINITYGSMVLSLKYNAWDFPLMGLNIHHTYYIKGHKPWEYDSKALVTLCEKCHKKRHENSSVPYYNHEMEIIGNLKVCDKCGGSGYIPRYSHVANGICFKCGGEGVILNEIIE